MLIWCIEATNEYLATMAHHADSSKANQTPLRDAKVGGIWRLGRKIGSGSFGDIYKGQRLDNARALFAIPESLAV